MPKDKKKTVAVTLQLICGKDDDIINWLEHKKEYEAISVSALLRLLLSERMKRESKQSK